MSCCCCEEERRIVICAGSDKAGATTLAAHMSYTKPVPAVPAGPTATHRLVHQDAAFVLTDVGREWREARCTDLKKLINRCDGVIFVVDASKPESLDKGLFSWIMGQRPSPATPVYVACNKQDLEGSAPPQSVAQRLGLMPDDANTAPFESESPTMWACQPCVATHTALEARAILNFFINGVVSNLLVPLNPTPSGVADGRGTAGPTPPQYDGDDGDEATQKLRTFSLRDSQDDREDDIGGRGGSIGAEPEPMAAAVDEALVGSASKRSSGSGGSSSKRRGGKQKRLQQQPPCEEAEYLQLEQYTQS